MSDKKILNVLKRIGGTLMLPAAMYIIVMIACFSNGKMFFGSFAMWKTLLVDVAVSVTCAMGIGLQFKAGRFDFSGGATMLLSAIIAGNVAKMYGNNPIIFVALCLICSVVLSVLVGLLYAYGRMPIVIVTIGMALLYEAVTCLLFNGSGINLVANIKLKVFSTYPTALFPLGAVIIIYVFYHNFTVTGKQTRLLANNQTAAVNIGVNEQKSVVLSYVFSGLIFGFATIIYASTGIHNASFSSLLTVGELFSNILPVFIGLMLGSFCNDAIGIVMGSLTLCLMSFGLETVISSEMGTAISNIFNGIFILTINVISARGMQMIAGIKRKLLTKSI